MAGRESQEGFLDYGSGRYKLMGRAGRDDYYLHAGEWMEVWAVAQWVAVQVLCRCMGVLVLPVEAAAQTGPPKCSPITQVSKQG